MKKLTLLIFLAIGTIQAQDLGYLLLSEETLAYDKQQHMLGGMFLGTLSYAYFDMQGNNELESYYKSATFVLGISLLKEANDKWIGSRAFDVSDISNAMFGQFMGATTMLLWQRHLKKRAIKKEQKLAKELARIDSFYE
jgi:hypothetical protein